MNDKTNKRYTATLVFTQEGLDGEVYSTLTFDPLVDEADANSDGTMDMPMSFGLGSVAAEAALVAMGIIDEDGEIVEEDEFHTTVNINASKPSKLN